MVPDVRLIAILRNPIDRAQSAFLHHLASGALPKDADLGKLVMQTRPKLERFGLVTGGWYAASLEPYQKIFGDQLLVLLHDDLEADPEAVYVRAARHVGADPSFVPPDLEQVRFSYVHRPGLDPDQALPMTLKRRNMLYRCFEPDLEKLEKMIDRDLSMWRPEPEPDPEP